MKINSISNSSPSFGGHRMHHVKEIIKDGADARNDAKNPTAAGIGVVATAGIGLKKIAAILSGSKKITTTGKNILNAATVAKETNMSAFKEFAHNLSIAFKGSKLTSWFPKMLNSPLGKKAGALAAGASAFGVVIAGLSSASSLVPAHAKVPNFDNYNEENYD